MKKNTNFQCPVCNMITDKDSTSSVYRGVQHFFCSAQCLERFTDNPGLYIGERGVPSVKQRGSRCIKQRLLKLEKTVPDEIALNIVAALQAMMGVIEVDVREKEITIVYDLIEVTTKQIEAVLEKTGNEASKNLGEMLKRAFIHYKEETILDNLEHESGSHSHN